MVSLLEFFGLVEASVGNVSRLLHFSVDFQKWLEEFLESRQKGDKRFAFLLAKMFKEEDPEGNMSELLSSPGPESDDELEDEFMRFYDDRSEIRTILTALRTAPHLEKKFLTMSFEDVIDSVVSKQNDVSKLRSRAEIRYPDGFFWVELDQDECGVEGALMQHCGTVGRNGKMHSLRDPQGNPHVSVEVSGDSVVQLKGKQNYRPDFRYWPYIVDFFKKKKLRLNLSYINRTDVPEDLRDMIASGRMMTGI